jgi:glycosyltransferase involved in cell wall biosynthesis
VQRLADIPGVEVTGGVQDVREHIARAAVYVVPIRIGGGTRLKIFEAMGMGKAVVSTTVGAEGLPVSDGRDVVIADAPEQFAASVVSLLRDPARRVQLEGAARRLVVEHYDWSAVSGQLEEALVKAAASPAAAAA